MKPSIVIAITVSIIAIVAVWAAGGNTLESFESNDPVWTRPITVANFPDPQNVAGTVNVGNLPTTQQVSGTVDVENLPTDTDGAVRVSVQNGGGPKVFQLVGVTSLRFDGSGDGGGWVAMTQACAAEFPGSRMAFSDEVMTAMDYPVFSDNGWINPRITAAYTATAAAFDTHGNSFSLSGGTTNCVSWSVATNTRRGALVTPTGGFDSSGCQSRYPVACSAPVE